MNKKTIAYGILALIVIVPVALLTRYYFSEDQQNYREEKRCLQMIKKHENGLEKYLHRLDVVHCEQSKAMLEKYPDDLGAQSNCLNSCEDTSKCNASTVPQFLFDLNQNIQMNSAGSFIDN